MPSRRQQSGRTSPFEAGGPPSWAIDWGEDVSGHYARLDVQGVSQGLRWIPPGGVLIGSPPDEPGRFGWEGPRRRVTISEGFWIFDSPCPQALWEAVMGSNPSRFQDPTRPVESVSWDEIQTFLTKLNDQVEGLKLSLPSEPQWEYACRAGTTAATYLEAVDDLGWYRGNCGEGYELPEGHDIGGWPGGQQSGGLGGTRCVKQKAANAWGLHDMLGNVNELCQDVWDRNRYQATAKRVSGSRTSERVARGGSWRGAEEFLRAAFRNGYLPGFRHDDLGFRCAEYKAGRMGPVVD